MRHDDTRLILATGGGAMVKAAYSLRHSAIGVGAGNGPAYIHHTADVRLVVKRILVGPTFDNGTCASEQSIGGAADERCGGAGGGLSAGRRGAPPLNSSCAPTAP